MTQDIRRLALLVGGGPAPGINGVISAVTIQAINNGIQVFGIQDGFKYLVLGRTDRIRRLSIAEVKNVYWRGGSILGTARTNPSDDTVATASSELSKTLVLVRSHSRPCSSLPVTSNCCVQLPASRRTCAGWISRSAFEAWPLSDSSGKRPTKKTSQPTPAA